MVDRGDIVVWWLASTMANNQPSALHRTPTNSFILEERVCLVYIFIKSIECHALSYSLFNVPPSQFWIIVGLYVPPLLTLVTPTYYPLTKSQQPLSKRLKISRIFSNQRCGKSQELSACTRVRFSIYLFHTRVKRLGLTVALSTSSLTPNAAHNIIRFFGFCSLDFRNLSIFIISTVKIIKIGLESYMAVTNLGSLLRCAVSNFWNWQRTYEVLGKEWWSIATLYY